MCDCTSPCACPKTATFHQNPQTYTPEHTMIRSRTTGRSTEISLGMPGNGQVPRNPFVSSAQRGYLNANPDVLGPKKLAEFNHASKGLKLPQHVKKAAK